MWRELLLLLLENEDDVEERLLYDFIGFVCLLMLFIFEEKVIT